MKLHVGTRKGLFELRRSPGGWAIAQASFLGDPVTIVLPREGELLAGLRHGHFGPKLQRSSDGERWEEAGTPAFPEKPEGEEGEWSIDTFWALEAGQDGTLWCGTIPGGLFKSSDGGASWSLMTDLWQHRKRWFGGGADAPGIHSVCIDPRDPKRVAVAVSVGGVWHSQDGGERWRCEGKGMRAAYMPPEQTFEPIAQDPHRMVRCPAAPDHLWVQHHNGVFRSRDDGATWEEIEVPPSSFGFAVAVHPRDPETAWFVPAIKDEKRIPVDGKVVVARTRDGGESFDVLDRGLPGPFAYDLTFRHALDIDPSGEILAFGSTTGSLWISEDQGDTWSHVSAHLPPIYAVRFGP